MIEQHEYRLLADFLSENWSDFCQRAEDNGLNETQADELINKLEQKANE